jgi:ATPase subunit of ABC transporter with duplicated ATPase domains
VFFLVMFLIRTGNMKLVVFVILYNSRMFGFIDVVKQIEEVKTIGGGKLAPAFKMLEDAYKMATTNVVHPLHFCPTVLTIDKIYYKVTDSLRLTYDGELTISLMPDKCRIVLLSGKKGCGKTTTMTVLAGNYDGNITSGVYADSVRLHNEMREFREHYVHVRQCMIDGYRANRHNTITCTLEQLFPDGSYQQIKDFLTHFDLVHKMPSDTVTRISTSETSLSPGETQAYMLASELWKAFNLKVPLLLLDEPERSVDVDTIKKIFALMLKLHKGTVFLITHSDVLKDHLRDCIVQCWKYKENEGGDLTFTIHDKYE